MADGSAGRIDGGAVSLVAITLAFVALKLTHNLAWSWWWVLAPVWIPLATGIVLVTVCVAIVVAYILAAPQRRGKR